MRINETREGCILEILVKPRSKQFSIVVEGEDIVVHCREEPVKGKVNKELVKELSRLFRKEVELVSGFSSREKRLLVRGVKKSEIEGFMKRE
jgi:hypothetical protein